MITPVTEEDINRVRGALYCIEKTGSIEYMNTFNAVIAELRALRKVVDAAQNVVIMPTSEQIELLESALRDAARLP